MMVSTVFGLIIEGKIPSKKVFENERILAIEDIHPVAPVHILIMPKKEIRNLQSVEPADLPLIGEIVEVAQKIARALQKAFGTDFVLSKIIGDEVFHAHIWIYPDPAQAGGNKDAFVENAEKIRKAIEK